MTDPSPVPPTRPRLVDIAFWSFVAGAAIMIVGGLMASTATFEAAREAINPSVGDEQVRNYLTVYRVSGVGSVVAAAGLAFLAGRTRRGDARFRLATLGLAAAIVVVAAVLAVGAGVAQPLVLLALLPITVGAVLLTRPAARTWCESEGLR